MGAVGASAEVAAGVAAGPTAGGDVAVASPSAVAVAVAPPTALHSRLCAARPAALLQTRPHRWHSKLALAARPPLPAPFSAGVGEVAGAAGAAGAEADAEPTAEPDAAAEIDDGMSTQH